MKSITLTNGIIVSMRRDGCGHYKVTLERDGIQLNTTTNETLVWDYMENDDVWDDDSSAKHNEAVAYLESLAERKFEQYDIDNYGSEMR